MVAASASWSASSVAGTGVFGWSNRYWISDECVAIGGNRAGRCEALGRAVVVELVGEGRHALGRPAVDLQRRAREVRVGDQRAEGRRPARRRRRAGTRPRSRRPLRVRHAEHRGDTALVVLRCHRHGHRDERSAAHGHAEAGDEEPLLVVVDAVDDRHAGEAPGGERRPDRLREDLAVDDARDRGAREGVDEVRRPARGAGTCAVWSGHPTLAAKASPAASASASDSCVSANAPLCTIARWKSPREPGETRWASTDRPPADWPAIVTLCGSPPNCAMLRCTQRSAACWSIKPVVAGRAAGPRGERGVGEEAERAQPVVDRDDDGAVRRELGAVVVAAGVLREAAAVDPHQHRPTGPCAGATSAWRR